MPLWERMDMNNGRGQADAFAGLHPAVNLTFFILAVGITMFVINPVFQIISAVSAVIYYHLIRRESAGKFSLICILPLSVLTAVLNPLFSHEGATILTYLPGGNPVTLESLIYGIGAGLMMAAVVSWFACLTAVFTSDKFVYLFGRLIPGLSLILSMALRFIPLFIKRLRDIGEAQKCIRGDSESDLWDRIKNGVKLLSALISWSLENAIDTADSMNSRGYGLKGRTAFSIYHFDTRDSVMLIWILFAAAMTVAGVYRGAAYWRYYPTVKGAVQDTGAIVTELLFLVLCMTPVMIDLYEDRRIRAMLKRNITE